MHNALKSTAIAAALTLGALALVPASASANSLYLGFDLGPYPAPNGHAFRHHDRGAPRDWWARTCSPDEALRKAEQMGVRAAHIGRVYRHAIRVDGRRWRQWVAVTFAREPHCPIIR